MDALLTWADDVPLFTVNDAARRFDHSREYLRLKLHRAVENNTLQRIERGKYTRHDDPMIYGTHVETPSYFSLWTALRHYDLTPQLVTRHQVITATHHNDLDTITFHSSKHMFGYGKHQYEGFHVFIAAPERLLIDCLVYEDVPVDATHELVHHVDPATTITYCKRYDVKAVGKRIGYLFQTIRDETLDELHEHIDTNYTVLDTSRPTNGTKDSEWKVIDNARTD